MSKIIKQLFTLFSLIFILTLPYFVFAGSADPMAELQEAGEGGGYESVDSASASAIAGTVVNAVLSLLGVIFIILIVYAGIKWMTAGGNEERVKEARTTITRAIIGLIIVAGAWAIMIFVFERLLWG